MEDLLIDSNDDPNKGLLLEEDTSLNTTSDREQSFDPNQSVQAAKNHPRPPARAVHASSESPGRDANPQPANNMDNARESLRTRQRPEPSGLVLAEFSRRLLSSKLPSPQLGTTPANQAMAASGTTMVPVKAEEQDDSDDDATTPANQAVLASSTAEVLVKAERQDDCDDAMEASSSDARPNPLPPIELFRQVDEDTSWMDDELEDELSADERFVSNLRSVASY